MAPPAPAPSPASHYDVLGLAPGATADDVKAAYRARILACHPDKRRAQPSPAAAAARDRAVGRERDRGAARTASAWAGIDDDDDDDDD